MKNDKIITNEFEKGDVFMEYVARLMEKRDELIDKYAAIIRKNDLTEKEKQERRKINEEIIYIDFELEKVKKEV